MAFGAKTEGTTRAGKLAYAKVLAGALAYLALRQGDTTGLCTFAADITGELPGRASSAHLVEVLTRLARLAVTGTTGIATSIDQFAQTRRRQSLVVVLSDLFDPNPDLLSAFVRLAARGHDITVLHLLDRAELDFPYDNPSTFLCMEDDRRLFVHPRTLRTAFVQEMARFVERTARGLAAAGIDYRRVVTDEPPARVLGELLRARESRR